jgi:hypothetical protein
MPAQQTLTEPARTRARFAQQWTSRLGASSRLAGAITAGMAGSQARVAVRQRIPSAYPTMHEQMS